MMDWSMMCVLDLRFDVHLKSPRKEDDGMMNFSAHDERGRLSGTAEAEVEVG